MQVKYCLGYKYPVTYSDKTTPLAVGEYFRVVMCLVSASTRVSEVSDIPFEITSTGELRVKDGEPVIEACWAKLGNGGTEDFFVVADEPLDADGKPYLGIPEKYGSESSDTVRYFSAQPAFATETEGTERVYFYLVAFDTREIVATTAGTQILDIVNPTFDTLPTRVYAYTVIKTQTGYTSLRSNMQVSVYASVSGYTMAGKSSTTSDEKDLTYYCSTKTAIPTSLTIDGATVTDQATIDAYLTPTVSGFVADKDGNYTLTASTTEDLIPYKLQTRESLSSGDWVDVDAWLAPYRSATTVAQAASEGETQKVLAFDPLPCYNRLRIGQGRSIPLPRVTGETTRFYRLKAE